MEADENGPLARGAHVEVFDSEIAAQSVLGDWRGLAEARGNAFVTPEWFFGWLRHAGSGLRPRVAAVRDGDGRLRGVLPLAAAAGRRGGLRNVPGDRFHPASTLEDEPDVARAAARALGLGTRLVPALRLENAELTADSWRALREGSGRSLAVLEGPAAELPMIDLLGLDWEGYLATRSRQLRSQIRRKRRAVEREHELRLRRAASAEECAQDLETLFRLHDERWQEKPGASSFADPRVRVFHRHFAGEALERGWLRLCVLEADAEPIAAFYGWRLGERWSYYQAGFDPAWGHVSPGFLLITETIKAAIEDGAAEYDLLLGDESFKLRLASHSARVRDLEFVARGHPRRLLASARRTMRHGWRRIPESQRVRLRGVMARVARDR